jgi:hypothetical protein
MLLSVDGIRAPCVDTISSVVLAVAEIEVVRVDAARVVATV